MVEMNAASGCSSALSVRYAVPICIAAEAAQIRRESFSLPARVRLPTFSIQNKTHLTVGLFCMVEMARVELASKNASIWLSTDIAIDRFIRFERSPMAGSVLRYPVSPSCCREFTWGFLHYDAGDPSCRWDRADDALPSGSQRNYAANA